MGSNNTAEAIKYVGNNLINGAETLVSSNGPILTPFPITQGEGINKTTISPTDATFVNNTGGKPINTDGFKIPKTFASSSKQNAKQIAKILGVPIKEAHDKLKEIKHLFRETLI